MFDLTEGGIGPHGWVGEANSKQNGHDNVSWCERYNTERIRGRRVILFMMRSTCKPFSGPHIADTRVSTHTQTSPPTLGTSLDGHGTHLPAWQSEPPRDAADGSIAAAASARYTIVGALAATRFHVTHTGNCRGNSSSRSE